MLNRLSSFTNNTNCLYLVGTPIGNFDDMTFRAINTLKSVDLIYCEDTRITGILLKHFEIATPMRSYNVMTENDLTVGLINELKSGKNIAVVSDAGMPGISDPGFLACREAVKAGFKPVVIPGVSASLTALVGSSIETNHFMFYGFLSPKHSDRIKELNSLSEYKETIIFYEAPHRIKESLMDIKDVFGDRYICLARELTKTYEEYLRGTISEILEVVESLKGEMVLIVEGKKTDDVVIKLNSLSIKEHYEFYLNDVTDPKIAMKLVARDRGISKSDVYQEVKGKNK